MKYKYYVNYAYDRKENNKIFKTDTADYFNIDWEINTREDIQKLELHIFNKLQPEADLRNQKIVALLVKGIFPLKG